jgi:hypothetical protein
MTTVVHCKRSAYDVYIGRPSKWGNPFKVDKNRTRGEAIALYRQWLYDSGLINDIVELKDKRLGCWCYPLACHGDVLAELADQLT